MLTTICCACGAEAWRWVMRAQVRDDGWRLPDELWARMEPLLPPRPRHPLGCHNPRVPDRAAMDAIFFVLRTGCQWNALNVTGICSSSSAHRRFLEWTEAGVFHEFWRRGLLAYDDLVGIDWDWLALDGTMGKAPLGGGKNRPQPYGQGRVGDQAEPADGRARRPARPCGRRRQPERPQADARDHRGGPGRAAGPDAPQGLCLDKGFDYPEVPALAAEFGFTLHLRTRGEERAAKREAGAKARRWVVERTHSWLNRFRRILIRWEKKPASYLAMLHLALGIITWRHARLPG